MAIAVYNLPPGGSKALPANTTEKVVGIQLNTGNNVSPFWTVFGKVVVNNPNASPATVEAQLGVRQIRWWKLRLFFFGPII